MSKNGKNNSKFVFFILIVMFYKLQKFKLIQFPPTTYIGGQKASNINTNLIFVQTRQFQKTYL